MQRGIDQFLVLGEGLVADGDAHDAARVLDLTVPIAVVDPDRVTTAVNHTRLLLAPSAVAARADLRRPARALHSPDVQAVLTPPGDGPARRSPRRAVGATTPPV